MSDLAPRRDPEDRTPDPAFIGRGFAWPMRVDHTGGLAFTYGDEDLDDAVLVVLATAPGERVMRPRFGCRIWELIFEPITGNTLGLMAQSVREAITEWEPRVEVHDVQVAADPSRDGLVNIHVEYAVRSTNNRRNLVYPFYVIPHEED
jgi:phage baseplate assembly protein W